MNRYEFIFEDGQRIVGEGKESGEAVLDFYHRNGFLPTSRIAEIRLLNEPTTSPEQSKPPDYRRSKR